MAISGRRSFIMDLLMRGITLMLNRHARSHSDHLITILHHSIERHGKLTVVLSVSCSLYATALVRWHWFRLLQINQGSVCQQLLVSQISPGGTSTPPARLKPLQALDAW